MRRNIGMMPLLVRGRTINFSQSVGQQDFGADDFKAKTSPFPCENFHEAVQTFGVSSCIAVGEVVKDGITILFNSQGEGHKSIKDFWCDLVEPMKIELKGFLFGRGFIDAVKSFLEPIGSFQPGGVFQPAFKDERFMFVQITGTFEQQEPIMHQGSSLSICQACSYLLANGFKALVKQLQHVPFVGNQMSMWQDLVDGIVIPRPHIGSNDGDLFPSALWQVLQITDDGGFGTVSKQVNNLMVLNIGNDAAVLIEQVQFVDTQAVYFCLWKTRLNVNSEFVEQDADQLLIDSHLISNTGEGSAQRCLLNVAGQALGHEMVLIHVWDWLKEGSAAFTTTVTFAMNDDPDVLPSDGLVQVGLWLYLMSVQFGMAAMSATRRRSDQLRLDVKIVFILINRKDVVVGQSQDVQKALSPKKELPHKFFGGPEIPVASEGRLLRASCFYSTHFSDVTLLCTDVKNEEFPRTFPNSLNLSSDCVVAICVIT